MMKQRRAANRVCQNQISSNSLFSAAHLRKAATFCALALAFVLGAEKAHAQLAPNFTWTNTAASDVWQDPSAWTSNLCDIVSNCTAGPTGYYPFENGVFDQNAFFTNSGSLYLKLNNDVLIASNMFDTASNVAATVTLDTGAFQFSANSTFVIGNRAFGSTTLYIASSTNADGNAGITGAGVYTASGALVVGNNGSGTLYITNGAVQVEGVTLGDGDSGQGTVIVSGSNSFLWCAQSSGGLIVGNSSNSYGNTILITNGGEVGNTNFGVSDHGTFRFGSGSSQSGSSNNVMTINNGGRFCWGTGTMTVGNGSTFSFPGTGSFSNLVIVGNQGTFSCSSPAATHTMWIGSSHGGLASNNEVRILAGGTLINFSTIAITTNNTLSVLGGNLGGNSLSGAVVIAGDVTNDNAVFQGYGTFLCSVNVTNGGLVSFYNSSGATIISNNLTVGSGSAAQVQLGTNFNSVVCSMTAVHSNAQFVLQGTLNLTDSGGFATGTYPLFLVQTNGVGFITNGVSSTLITNAPLIAVSPTIGTKPNPSYLYTVDTSTFSNAYEIVNLIVSCTNCTSASGPFRIISNTRSGSNIVLTWTASSIGVTNHVQVTSGTANGSYTNNYADLFVINGVSTITNTYTDVGGATNRPSRYYRIEQTP